MIKYKKDNTNIAVLLDGKIVGSIRPVAGGYRYFPRGKGEKFAGEVFKTIQQVKESLESE